MSTETLKLFGTMDDLRSASYVFLASIAVTLTYVIVANQFFNFVPTGLEFWGVVFNFACVYLTTKEEIWCWPFGIVAVVLLGILFYNYGLYSSMVLSLVYFLPVQFIGWYNWLYGGENKTELKVSFLTNQHRLFYVALVLSFTVLWGSFLSTYTNAIEVYWDASILALSVVAQWLLTNKKLESWILWIIVNVLSIGLFWSTGMYVLAMQYCIFLGTAILGMYHWTQSYREQ